MNTYTQLLEFLKQASGNGTIQKHYTHDSVFFIIQENQGFKTVKFYNDSADFRISGFMETLSDAYNEAFHTL